MINILESLSPLEKKILPFLDLPIPEIEKKTSLDSTSVLRALRFLENKDILKIKTESKTIIDLGTNGIFYKKNQLPERKLLILLEQNSPISLDEAKRNSKLSDNEFKVSLGILKSKALIELTNNKIFLKANKEEIIKKSLEEQLLEILPTEKDKLEPQHLLALENLKKRKDIIEIQIKKIISYELSAKGKELSRKKIALDLLEEVSSDVIKNWSKGNKFRRYDIKSHVPEIYGGKKHFVSQAIEYGKKIWLELGFKEMTSPLTMTSFWNFDALFTAQDHPVREMHDTFFIKDVKGSLPNTKIVQKVKQSHESGIGGSKGWQYSWNEKEATRTILRTHTTCISAQTLSKIKKDNLPAKFFAIGKCFRNETIDWSHGFEFNQTEGIVVDEHGNLRNLLGYLKEFFNKMGFKDIRFTPAYFPYTEPSVEINWYHPEKKTWLELGGAGIFRPELTIPLLGKHIPVLAWGPGFDRMIMDYYAIKDLRELYSNDIKDLRNKKTWIK